MEQTRPVGQSRMQDYCPGVTNMYSGTNLCSGAVPYALQTDQRNNDYEYVTNISVRVQWTFRVQ